MPAVKHATDGQAQNPLRPPTSRHVDAITKQQTFKTSQTLQKGLQGVGLTLSIASQPQPIAGYVLLLGFVCPPDPTKTPQEQPHTHIYIYVCIDRVDIDIDIDMDLDIDIDICM